MEELLKRYSELKGRIKKRISEFRNISEGRDDDIFQELCFCLLTPQSKAVVCDEAVGRLRESGCLRFGGRGAVKKNLRGVRFPNNKSSYIILARKRFKGKDGCGIKGRLDAKDAFKTREWLVKNVKGLGYKEASHFLRNIGLGKDLAILDVHILKNLKRYGVITDIPTSLSRKRYTEIEDKMRGFSRRIDIPLEELDLLFWSNETGFVFK